MEIGVRRELTAGSLVELFPRWGEELFPLHVIVSVALPALGQSAYFPGLRCQH